MKHSREEMAAILNKLAPALSQKDLVQIFVCFCFEDNYVHAYDDVASLRYPAKFGFTGGIRGEVLLGFLNTSRAKEVEITHAEGTVLFKAGRSKHNAAILPAEDFLFTPPSMKAAETLEINPKFVDALSKVSISMGRDASQVWRYGVTVTPMGDGAYTFYATDDKTICRVRIGKGDTPAKATLLPPRFVDLFLLLAKTDTPKTLSLTPDWISVKFQSGLVLFSKGVSGASPKKYQGLLADLDTQTKGAVPLPKGVDRCLANAALVIKHAKDPHTRLSATGERLNFETQSEAAGDIRDSLPCEHTKISVFVAPDLIERGLPFTEKIAIVPSCVRMSGNRVDLYICTHSGGAETEAPEVIDAGEVEE